MTRTRTRTNTRSTASRARWAARQCYRPRSRSSLQCLQATTGASVMRGSWPSPPLQKEQVRSCSRNSARSSSAFSPAFACPLCERGLAAEADRSAHRVHTAWSPRCSRTRIRACATRRVNACTSRAASLPPLPSRQPHDLTGTAFQRAALHRSRGRRPRICFCG